MAAAGLGLYLVVPGSAGGSWACSDLLLWRFSSLFPQEIMCSEVLYPGDGVAVWQRSWLEMF